MTNNLEWKNNKQVRSRAYLQRPPRLEYLLRCGIPPMLIWNCMSVFMFSPLRFANKLNSALNLIGKYLRHELHRT
jgi:hypothetical protein